MKVEIDIPDDLHPDAIKVVLATANDLAAKLHKVQVKYGLKEGWRNPPPGAIGDGKFFSTEDELQKALINHINKNDPLDVIAYCAFTRELGFNLPAVVSAPKVIGAVDGSMTKMT